MSAKKKLDISPRAFHLFIGILLSLFSLVLIVDMGVVSRALSFPFKYVFGLGAYLIYLILLINGFCYIFLDHRLIFKRKIRNPAIVIFFIAFLVLASLIATKDSSQIILGSGNGTDGTHNFFHEFNERFFDNSNNGYFYRGFVSSLTLTTTKLGGGILGFSLTAIINLLGTTVTYIISISFLVIGVLLFFLPTIIGVIKSQMEKQGLAVGEDEEKTAVKTAPKKSESKPKKKKTPQRVSNIDVISTASSLPEEERSTQNRTEVSTSIYSSSESATYDSSYYQPNGAFVPARFITSTDPNSAEEVAATPRVERSITSSVPTTSAPREVVVEEEPQVVESKPSTPRVEQMDLFEEEEEVDTSLAATQHVHNEPVAVPKDPISLIPDASPRLKFIPPSADELLNDYEDNEEEREQNVAVAEQRRLVINKTFESFGVGARCVSYTIGPAVTRFNIEYDYNVSVNQVKRVVSDIAVRLGGETGTRFEQIVAGQAYSGLEVPNPYTTSVPFKEVVKGLPDPVKHASAVGFGKNISGDVITADFVTFPHMLLAGTTGSGKSVFIHSLIMTLIMRNSPDDLKLVLIDPKQVEMNMYEDLSHLLTPIIGNAEKARTVMNKLCDEMERRNGIFKPVRVTNIKSYNEWAEKNNKERLPYIFVIFDEYADCHDVCKDIEIPIRRLAQKARSAGIHILLATQRPSVDVVTGTLKGNLPTHVALLTASATDSMVILGEGGAETLLGRGDMLIQVPGFSRGGSIRVQSPYVADDEIKRVVEYLVTNYPVKYDPQYDIEEEAASAASSISATMSASNDSNEDELYAAVKEWAMSQDYASMSRIQREFSIGFNRAGRLFKRLQDDGIVASKPDTASSAKGCRVLVKSDKFGDGSSENNDEVEEIIDTAE
ncbi:MAG: DNA translocase FtsK [Bacilli bacterium]|nr:DNA translocase FtsK [Bacilli bacterium]